MPQARKSQIAIAPPITTAPPVVFAGLFFAVKILLVRITNIKLTAN